MNVSKHGSPVEQDDEPIVGPDGELIEPDKSVDPLAYQRDYVSRFRVRLPRGYMEEWDDSRVVERGLYGCFGVFVIMAVIAIITWLTRLPS